jgi:hypothetical protein
VLSVFCGMSLYINITSSYVQLMLIPLVIIDPLCSPRPHFVHLLGRLQEDDGWPWSDEFPEFPQQFTARLLCWCLGLGIWEFGGYGGSIISRDMNRTTLNSIRLYYGR